jgi:alpha-tubulin suppressor-like RCC1 family protein
MPFQGSLMFPIIPLENSALWSWGYNGSSVLGYIGADTSSPVQVGALTNWTQADISNNHTTAIKTDGTIWTWGGE